MANVGKFLTLAEEELDEREHEQTLSKLFRKAAIAKGVSSETKSFRDRLRTIAEKRDPVFPQKEYDRLENALASLHMPWDIFVIGMMVIGARTVSLSVNLD